MRFNRGTLLLLLVAIVAIVGVLVVTIYQAAAPGADSELVDEGTDDGEAQAVAVFPGVDTGSVVRLEVRDNRSGMRTVLYKQGERWGMDGLDLPGREQVNTGVVLTETPPPAEVASTGFSDVDAAQVTSLLGRFLGLEDVEAFEAGDLDQYGLTEPAYTVFAVGEDSAVYVMYIGGENPSGTRYYTTIEQIAPGDTSPRLPQLRGELDRLDVDTSIDDVAVLGADLPELPAALANEVDLLEMQATVTALDADDPDRPEIVATFSALVEARNAAVSAGMDATEEAGAAGASDATEEADVMATEDAMAEATPVVIDDSAQDVDTAPVEFAAVTLEGPATVYLMPATGIDAVIAILTDPPVIEVQESTPVPALIPEETAGSDEEVVDVPIEPDEAEAGEGESGS